MGNKSKVRIGGIKGRFEEREKDFWHLEILRKEENKKTREKRKKERKRRESKTQAKTIPF